MGCVRPCSAAVCSTSVAAGVGTGASAVSGVGSTAGGASPPAACAAGYDPTGRRFFAFGAGFFGPLILCEAGGDLLDCAGSAVACPNREPGAPSAGSS